MSKIKFSRVLFKEGLLVSISDYYLFGVTFVITLIISNFYGLEQFGVYTIILSLSQIIIASVNGSYTAIIRRDLSLHPEKVEAYTSNIVSIRFVAVVFILIVPILITLSPFKSNYSLLIGFMILSKGIESINETFLTVYQTIGKIHIYSYFKLSQATLILFTVSLSVYFNSTITYIYSLPIFVYLIFSFSHLYFAKSIELKVHFKIEKQFLKYLRKEAWPLFVSVIVSQLNIRGSILIISRFVSPYNLGIYSIGVTLISLATTFINSLVIVLFPTLTKAFSTGSIQAYKTFKALTFYSFLLGIIIFLLFNVLSSFIPILYSDLTSIGINHIRTMSFAIIPIIAMGISSYMFTIIGVQKQGMQLMLFLTIINLFIFAIATYYFNFVGSIISYSITLTITFLSFFLRINQIIKRRISV